MVAANEKQNEHRVSTKWLSILALAQVTVLAGFFVYVQTIV